MTAERKSRRKFLKSASATIAAGGLVAVLPRSFAAAGGSRGRGTSPGAEFTGAGSLRAHATPRGLLVGCAVVPELLSNHAQYAGLVAEQCSILVPENALKWEALRPAPDKFDFHGADTIMAFA